MQVEQAVQLLLSLCGFLNFDKRLDVLGIVLNNVASLKHLNTIKGYEDKINVPIIGVIFRNKRLVLKERHLWLIPVLKSSRSSVNRIVPMSTNFKNLCLKGLRNLHVTRKFAVPISSPKHSKPDLKLQLQGMSHSTFIIQTPLKLWS